jgi:hypothetical protein
MGAEAIKDPAKRINNHPPARGEWVDLEPLTLPILPAYPTHWYQRALRPFVVPKWVWDLWRSDPVTSQWSPGDLATALELGERYYRLKDADRLRIQTYLGLNARGRRELRWRNASETVSAAKADAHAAEVRRLRIIRKDHDPA